MCSSPVFNVHVTHTHRWIHATVWGKFIKRRDDQEIKFTQGLLAPLHTHRKQMTCTMELRMGSQRVFVKYTTEMQTVLTVQTSSELKKLNLSQISHHQIHRCLCGSVLSSGQMKSTGPGSVSLDFPPSLFSPHQIQPNAIPALRNKTLLQEGQ